MFTGIITELGSVESTTQTPAGRAMVIAGSATAAALAVGDSVAVNGVCLTAVAVDDGRFAVDVVEETLRRSGLGGLGPGSPVNLERPMLAAGRFDGHIVQGHVDGVGTVRAVVADGASRRMTVSLPVALARYVVEKGSIAVDGVSLTVTGVTPPAAADASFEVALIPHTLRVTALGSRGAGDTVNLEVDVIAKYVERLVEASQ